MTGTGVLRGHRDFRRLWTADLASQFGDRITALAVPLLAATELGASAFEVSLLRAVQTAAYQAGVAAGMFNASRLATETIGIAVVGAGLATLTHDTLAGPDYTTALRWVCCGLGVFATLATAGVAVLHRRGSTIPAT